MNITWYGQSCFRLQSTQQNVLVDPYSPRQVGLRGPNFKATLTILTNPEDEKAIKKDSKERGIYFRRFYEKAFKKAKYPNSPDLRSNYFLCPVIYRTSRKICN